MTAPPQTSQSGANGRQTSTQDAARRSEPPSKRTLTRAVVIGGSIAGMFASAACAAHFDEVRLMSDLVATRHCSLTRYLPGIPARSVKLLIQQLVHGPNADMYSSLLFGLS